MKYSYTYIYIYTYYIYYITYSCVIYAYIHIAAILEEMYIVSAYRHSNWSGAGYPSQIRQFQASFLFRIAPEWEF